MPVCALMFALRTLCLWIIIMEGAQSIQPMSLSGVLLFFFECLLSLSGASPTQSSRISSLQWTVSFVFTLALCGGNLSDVTVNIKNLLYIINQ